MVQTASSATITTETQAALTIMSGRTLFATRISNCAGLLAVGDTVAAVLKLKTCFCLTGRKQPVQPFLKGPRSVRSPCTWQLLALFARPDKRSVKAP